MELNQMENKDVFQDVIRDYETARPGYPPQLYRDIIAFSELGMDAKVLEVGSGPGQATAYFVENGYHITALGYLKSKLHSCGRSLRSSGT